MNPQCRGREGGGSGGGRAPLIYPGIGASLKPAAPLARADMANAFRDPRLGRRGAAARADDRCQNAPSIREGAPALSASEVDGGGRRGPERIGRLAYRTYTLFLVPSQQWLRREKKGDLRELHDAFLGFGRAIGRDHAAIWLRRGDRNGTVDVDAGKRYCDPYGIGYNDGPLILFTEENPERNQSAKPLVIAFGELPARRWAGGG